MGSSTILSQIHDLAASLHDSLPPPRAEAENGARSSDIPPLNLPRPVLERLCKDLEAFNITSHCQTSLLELYQTKISGLERAYHDEYEKAISALQLCPPRSSTFYHTFKDTLENKFMSQAQATWHAVMSEVERCLSDDDVTRVKLGVSSIQGGAIEDSPAAKTSRGHDSDAVSILEQAFRHTPNITQAEKYRLAEVTGLKPKQVTIWFQNRRNRKGKRGPKTEPTTPPPKFDPLPEQPRTPSSPPTRDFTLSEKKRKTYGALGRGSPSPSDSDSDDSSFNLKKPRLPRACSTTSQASASSLELEKSFASWSSPSSRSVSSSSSSSTPSDCFDSPSRVQNVFRLINPLKYEGHVKQDMPAVTMTPPPRPSYAGVGQGQRSPFTSDNVNSFDFAQQQGSGFHTNSGELKLNFGDLQFNQEALHKGLRESIQQALDISAMRQQSERSVSGSSWATMESTTTDDDGWVDEDDAMPATLSNVTVNGAGVEQRALMLDNASQQSQPSNTAWIASQTTTGSGDKSTDSNFPYTTPEENDCFDLNQFFESAATASTSFLPSSSPFVPHQHYSPQASLHHSNNPSAFAAGTDTGASCLDVEVEMSDIQDILNSSFIPPVPSQTSMTNSGGDMTSGEGSQGQAQGGDAPAQFYLNFDLSSEMFSLG